MIDFFHVNLHPLDISSFRNYTELFFLGEEKIKKGLGIVHL